MKKNGTIRAAISGGLTAMMCKLGALTAFATEPTTSTGTGDFASSNIAQGTQNLIKDISTWFIMICALAGTAAAVYCLIRRGMADEVDGKMWTKRCVTAMICAVGGALIGGIVTLVSGYFA